MNSKQTIITIIILLVLGVITASVIILVQRPATDIPDIDIIEGGVFCTLDAMQCPDGSYVGRVGPNCEFAICPGVSSQPVSPLNTIVKNKINVASEGFDVSITSHEIVSDSRCPTGVQCVWAGTVNVRATLIYNTISTEVVFSQNTPISIGDDRTVTLVEVSPEAIENRSIAPGDYEFTFEVKRR